ncbi:hypothetical protein [Frateuria aurantia]
MQQIDSSPTWIARYSFPLITPPPILNTLLAVCSVISSTPGAAVHGISRELLCRGSDGRMIEDGPLAAARAGTCKAAAPGHHRILSRPMQRRIRIRVFPMASMRDTATIISVTAQIFVAAQR